VYENGKIKHVETSQGVRGRVNENDRGGEFNCNIL
jgi:hypothetical protein